MIRLDLSADERPGVLTCMESRDVTSTQLSGFPPETCVSFHCRRFHVVNAQAFPVQPRIEIAKHSEL